MPVEKQIFTYELEAETRKYKKSMKDAFGMQEKHVKANIKASQKLDKSTKTISKSVDNYKKSVNSAFDADQERIQFLLTYSKQIEAMDLALIDATEEQTEQINKQHKVLEKQYKDAVRGANDYEKRLLLIKEAAEDLRKEEERRKASKITEAAGYSGHDMGEDFGEGFKDILSGMGSKDMMGMAGGLLKSMGSLGKGMQGKAMRAQASGAAGMKVGGLDKIMGSIAPALNAVSKMGPMLMAVSGALMGIVKIFLDAEAEAKEFNKTVLETTSTAGFMAKNFGHAAAAQADLKDTMAEMYSQATALDNINWGISADTHKQIQAALGAQGVQLDKTKEYFDEIKAGRVENKGMVKDWGSMTKMSVAYSRAFGVSVSEVTDLQGEMMSELGVSFDNVQSGFQAMYEGATDAGIASNKFFGQMRAIASDMNLFNLRMESSAKLMSKLDKAMSPKKATEFFSTISKFYKGMGIMDRAKSVYAAGHGATKGIEQKALSSSIDALASDLNAQEKGGQMGDELKKALGKGGSLIKFFAKNDKKLSGEQRDAIVTASRQQQRMARGDTLSLAAGLSELDPMSTVKHLDKIAQVRFGKPIEKLNDLEIQGMKAYSGMDEDMVENFSKMKMAMDTTKETIAEKLASGIDVTQEEADMLKKLGINYKAGAKDTKSADDLRHKDSTDVFNSMGKDQKALLTGSKETIDYAKRQSELTSTVIDKIGNIMEFISGQLYKVFASIWDVLLDVAAKFGLGDENQRKLDKLQVQAIRDGSKEIAEIASKSKSIEEFNSTLFKTTGLKTEKAMYDLAGQLDSNRKNDKDLNEKLSAAQTQEEKDSLAEQIKANNSAYDGLQAKMSDVHDAIVNNAKGGRNNIGQMADIAAKAATQAGLGDDLAEKISDIIRESGPDSKGLTLAFDQLNLTNEQQVKILEKMRLSLSPEQLANATATANKALGIGGSAGPQQEASKAVATPPAVGPRSPTPPADPVEPPTPAQAAGAPPSTQGISSEDMKEATATQGQNVQGAMDDLGLSLKKASGGVVFNGPYLKGKYGSQIESSVYNAASKALFEYWMYQQGDRGDALKALKSGVNPRDLGASFLQKMSGGSAAGSAFGDVAKDAEDAKKRKQASPNAEGGVVGHPAPGEYFASVKPGETIVPVGGGGGTTKVVLELKGDMLKQIIRATALNTLNEHDRARTTR